ncbi:flavodoxin family protein [Leptotrichia hongkongensis]|uniref:flavodoxin family protein n=1 Tax=Leptotrichia hongkongensis TaxID=554406 RepID=UPI0035A82553
MSSLVVFSTSTGNTKKIADAIFSVLKDKDKKITDVNEINTININEYERIIIGGWIDKGEIDEKAKEFLTKLKNKKLGLFVTMGGNPETDREKNCFQEIKKSLEKNGNIVEKTFVCQGAIDPNLINKFREMTKQGTAGPFAATPEREARWAEAAKHPDEKDIENAKRIFGGL